MNEFDNIKMRIKMAIMLEPTISLKIQHDYCDMLEICNTIEEIPIQLQRYVKIVLTEMKEEQEENEEFKKEIGDSFNINNLISSIDNTIAEIENGNNCDKKALEDQVEKYRNKANELFDYIDETGKVKINTDISLKVRKYDWKRELRKALREVIVALNSDNYYNDYVKETDNSDILWYVKSLKELENVFGKYNLYVQNIMQNEELVQQYLNSRLVELNQEQLMMCLSYLLKKEQQSKGTINQYLDNRVLVRIATLLYNHLYNLI